VTGTTTSFDLPGLMGKGTKMTLPLPEQGRISDLGIFLVTQ
jgi:hypothetical protein